MIDYAHIPAHMRCSDRHLIVPDYPGGCKWWRQEERKPTAATFDRCLPLNDRQAVVLEMLKQGDVSVHDINQRLGLTKNGARQTVDGMSSDYPISEYKRDGVTWFCLHAVEKHL